MTSVCNDNLLYYYIINIKKILTASEIISMTLVFLVILLFIIHFKRNKENHTLRKEFFRVIIVLALSFIIPAGLDVSGQYIMNNTDYNNCLEDEERNAIQETDNITPPEYIEKHQKKETEKEETEEKIEVVEEDGGGNGEEPSPESTEDENAIYFLNVGAGTEAFIIQDQGHFGLIDMSYDSKAKYIVKQLKKLGAKELDFVVVTHAHLDHIGGYNKVMSSMKVNTLYIKNPGNVNSDYVPTYLDMIKTADEKGTTICDVTDQLCQEFDLGYFHINLYNTDFYHSKGVDGADRSRIENANSITTLVTINNRKIYFASDIGDYFNNRRELLTSQKVGDIDVYKAAHHGYITYNNSLEALSILKPEYSVITNNKLQSRIYLKRVKNTSPEYQKTYYTTEGTVTLHVDGDGTMKFTQVGE